MARGLTNKTGFASARESSLGTADTAWRTLEVNTIGDLGANVTNTPRDPISTDRQRRKGSTTDLDSTFSVETDLYLSALHEFLEGFCFAEYVYPGTTGGAGVANSTHFVCSEVIDGGAGVDQFTVTPLNGDLVAGELIYARGFDDAANNGLHVVVAASAAATINVATGTLVADAAPAAENIIDVCGIQGATGDFTISSGDLVSLGGGGFDWADYNLSVGMFVKIGGTATDTFFATAADNQFARITAISTLTLTLDKGADTFVNDAGVAKDIQIFYGRFLKNLDVNAATFLERSYTFEVLHDDLQNPTGTGDEYSYAVGNYCNTIGLNLPLTDKATLSLGFIGTDTDAPTTVRKSGAATPIAPNRQEMFNTSADVVRLRITEVDETGLSTDFKSCTITLNNNVSPEKVLGTLGAAYMNYGNINVDVEAELLFTDSDVVAAIRDNTTVTFDAILQNDDGAIAIDLPSVVLGGGAMSFPVNESVTISTTVQSFQDATLSTSLGFSLFPHIPT